MFNKKFEFINDYIEDINKNYILQRSKYVQSKIVIPLKRYECFWKKKG